MEPTYLRAWSVFHEEAAKLIPGTFSKLTRAFTDANSQLKALRALSACKHEAPILRDQIVTRLVETHLRKSHKWELEAVVDGLQGFANCAYLPQGSEKVIEKLYERLTSKGSVAMLNFE